MELCQLRAFVEVAEAGHFGHAAQHLHLTQPALTQRIQALERELGLQLLERNARGYAPMPPADGTAYRSLSLPPLIEFGLAYRNDEPSPIVANMVQLTREIAGHESSAEPSNGEMV